MSELDAYLASKAEKRQSNPPVKQASELDAYLDARKNKRNATSAGDATNATRLDMQLATQTPMGASIAPFVMAMPEKYRRPLRSAHSGVLTGGLFGWDDELLGVIGGDEAKEKRREVKDFSRSDAPISTFAGEMVGSSVLPVGNVARTASMGKKIGTGAAIGAVTGAAYGSGEADGGDRKKAAIIGGGIGTATGAVLPPAVSLVAHPSRIAYRKTIGGFGRLYDAALSLFGKEGGAVASQAEKVAVAAVRRSMERSGMTIEQIMQKVDEFGDDRTAVLAEVIGQDAVNALTALTRKPGTTSEKAQGVVAERFGGFNDRAQADLQKASGVDRSTIDADMTQMVDEGRAAAKPLYDAAFDAFKTISSPQLKRLAETSPLLQASMKKAEKRLANEAAAQGKKPDDLSQLQFWDLVKRDLDDASTRAAAKPGNAEEVRQIEMIRKPVVGQLDAFTGGKQGPYATAREAGSVAPRLEAAQRTGERILSLKPKDFKAASANAFDTEQKALKMGAAEKIGSQLDEGRMTPQRFRTQANQDRVANAFGPEAGGQFVKDMGAEAELRELASRWGPRMNSVTGTALSNGGGAGEEAVRAGSHWLRGEKADLLIQAVNLMRRRGYSQEQQDAMGELLLSNPQEGLKRLGISVPKGGGGGPANALAVTNSTAPAVNQPANSFAKTTKASGIAPNLSRGDLGAAALGAGAGGLAPADSLEERGRNIAIGAGGAVAAKKGGATTGRIIERTNKKPLVLKAQDEVLTLSDKTDLQPGQLSRARQAREAEAIASNPHHQPLNAGDEYSPLQIFRGPVPDDGFGLNDALLASRESYRARVAELAERMPNKDFIELAGTYTKTSPRSIEDAQDIMLRHRGFVVRAAQKAAASGAADLAGGGRGVNVFDLPPVKSSGFGGAQSDIGNTALGAAVGGFAPADSTEERTRNAFLMAGATAGAGRLPNPRHTQGSAAGLPRKPKIQKDIPLGTPKKAGPSRMDGNTIAKGYDDASGMGAARAVGDASVVRNQARAEASEMLKKGSIPKDVHKRTGLMPIEYNGKTTLIEAPDMTPDQVLTMVYTAISDPAKASPPMRAILEDLGVVQSTLQLGSARAPQILGGKSTPKIKDKPANVFSTKPKGPVRSSGTPITLNNQDIAAGAVGGAAGVTQGDTWEEKRRNAVMGAGMAVAGSKALSRSTDRVIGSQSLPKGTKRSRWREDDERGELYKLPVTDNFGAEVEFSRMPRSGAVREPEFAEQFVTYVNMDFTSHPGNYRNIHKAFDATFESVRDHAKRHRKPIYEFSGSGEGHERLYERSLSRAKLPDGYSAHIIKNGTNGNQHFVITRLPKPALKALVERMYYDPKISKPQLGSKPPASAASTTNAFARGK